jgi:hypothetical protein
MIDEVVRRDGIVRPPRRMTNELASNEKVVHRPIPKGITHVTVQTGDSAPVRGELQHAVFLGLGHVAELGLMGRPRTRPCGDD